MFNTDKLVKRNIILIIKYFIKFDEFKVFLMLTNLNKNYDNIFTVITLHIIIY